MARLTYPTAPILRDRLSADGNYRPDALTEAGQDGTGLHVTVTDGGYAVTLTQPSAGRWNVLVTGQRAGDTVALPESIVSRANRLMSADGVSIMRDWRTKTHVLRAGPRRVLPLLGNETVSAVLTGSGWRAVAGSTPTPSAPSAPAPVTAPIAPTAPVPSAPSAPSAARSAPSAPALQVGGLPAAYRGEIVLSKATRAKWAATSAVHDSGYPQVIGMIGPSGAGKTHAVHALSAADGRTVIKFDASGVIEPGDWFGTVTLDAEGTHFVPSDVLTALTSPGRITLLLDEANRSAQRALNAMLPVLDGSGSFTVPQTGKRMAVNPDVLIVLTANIGSRHLAVEPLDEAIRTRVDAWIEVDHLSEDEERDLLLTRLNGPDAKRKAKPVPTFSFAPGDLSPYLAERLASLGRLVRGASEQAGYAPLSTRQLLSAARLMAVGLDPRIAVETAILGGYSAEGGDRSERAKVNVHVTGIAWKEAKPGAVHTGTGQCHCGHEAAQHGIGTDISASTHCRTCVREWPTLPSKQCMAYSEVMMPEDDEDSVPGQ